jgi:hypothetical protein
VRRRWRWNVGAGGEGEVHRFNVEGLVGRLAVDGGRHDLLLFVTAKVNRCDRFNAGRSSLSVRCFDPPTSEEEDACAFQRLVRDTVGCCNALSVTPVFQQPFARRM